MPVAAPVTSSLTMKDGAGVSSVNSTVFSNAFKCDSILENCDAKFPGIATFKLVSILDNDSEMLLRYAE